MHGFGLKSGKPQVAAIEFSLYYLAANLMIPNDIA